MGIVGHTCDGVKGKTALPDMIKTIQYTNKEQVDIWSDSRLSLARVSLGLTNAEPQPIFNDDHSLLIVMEGNIFDYEESKSRLISKGYKFRFEKNDAEYCLHLYEEMGTKCFKELNGSFAIVIYNLLTRELLLVNDRFSSRQLFYYFHKSPDGNCLLFGTQLASILVSPNVPRELDVSALFEFFYFQRVFGTKTYYKNINVLRPAHVLTYNNKDLSIFPYWRMKYNKQLRKIKHSREYYVTKLAQVLRQSINRKTMEDRRYGLLLSGGLDSRMVLAATDKEFMTFTFGDYENSEIKIAQKIAKANKSKNRFLKRSSNYYPDLLDVAVRIGDGMYVFFHAHFIGFFDKLSRESDILLQGNPPELFFRGSGLPAKVLNAFGIPIPLPALGQLNPADLPHDVFKNLRSAPAASGDPGPDSQEWQTRQCRQDTAVPVQVASQRRASRAHPAPTNDGRMSTVPVVDNADVAFLCERAVRLERFKTENPKLPP